MVGQVCSAVHATIGPMALVGQVGLEGFHHSAGCAQTSNGRAGELAAGQRTQQPQTRALGSPLWGAREIGVRAAGGIHDSGVSLSEGYGQQAGQPAGSHAGTG